MMKNSVRVSVNVPAPLYRKLKERSVATGQTVRQLVVSGIENIVKSRQHSPAGMLQFPLILSRGPKVNLTNDQIYEYIASEDVPAWIKSGYKRFPF